MFALKAQMHEIDRLKRRSDFLRINKKGRKWVAKGLIVLVCENGQEKSRFGLTVTKRLEKSAVKRNRMKRRLRAAAYDILPKKAQKGCDYVLIARPETATRLYSDLQKDLTWCLKKLECLTEPGAPE